MATQREPRRRKDTGLRKYILRIYSVPVYKYLRGLESDPVRDLIYGLGTCPPAGTGARKIWDAEADKLRPLWRELRDDILAAQEQYMPDKKPWGCRFDRKTRTAVYFS